MADRGIHLTTLLKLKGETARLTYVLENFTSIRQKKPDGKTGRPWPGLQLLEDKDKEFIAKHLTARDYGGRKATSTLFQMAEKATMLLKMVDVTHDQKFELGRVLLSAFCYAGIYNLERLDEAGDSPYYVVGTGEPLPEKSIPERTRFEPFPPWTTNKDDSGNRLVKPSHPCPPKFEVDPEIDPDAPWVRAVHKLENTPFRINKEMLDWAITLDRKVSTRLVHKEPSDYRRRAKALYEDQYKEKNLADIKKRRKKDEELRKIDKKANAQIEKDNKKIVNKNRTLRKNEKELLPYKQRQRSDGYHTTKEEDDLYNTWVQDCKLLEKHRWRVITRRQRFERELVWATELAEEGKPFYQRVSVDYRGRVYLPDFSYQGSDFCRGVIEFSESRRMNKQARLELMRHTANELGVKVDHEIKYFYAATIDETGKPEIQRWADIGNNPPASVKALKEADKPHCFLRACMEWSADVEHGRAHKSALPIAADHKNSAFVHQGKLLDNALGKELVARCEWFDLYEQIAEHHPSYPRKLIKAVMVPWSYGGGKYSASKKLRDYRIDNPGEIKDLDYMTVPQIDDLVDDIFDLLESEVPACVDFRDTIERVVNRAKDRTDRDPSDGIEWKTLSRFEVHQKVFKAKPHRGTVARGWFENDCQLKCKLPKEEIDWEAMRTKAAPNLVHSQDATVVHLLLAGSVEIEGINDYIPDGVIAYDPLVTIHDSFSVLPSDAKPILNALEALTDFTYLNDPLVQFGMSVIGEDFPTRDRVFGEIFNPEKSPYT
jgi:hypothetical protein